MIIVKCCRYLMFGYNERRLLFVFQGWTVENRVADLLCREKSEMPRFIICLASSEVFCSVCFVEKYVNSFPRSTKCFFFFFFQKTNSYLIFYFH